MARNGLKELCIDELKDLYDAENRLVKALPKMAKAANSEKLRAGLEEHLEQTKGQVDRLKDIFEGLSSTVQVAGCYEQIQVLSHFMPPIIRVFSAFQR